MCRLGKSSKEPQVTSLFKPLKLDEFPRTAEENEAKRANYIASAISTISDVLPFNSKNHLVWEDRELVKHLILCLPECPHPVKIEKPV